MEGHAGVGAGRDEQIMIDDSLGLANEYFLTQLIQQPTHRQGNTLDLIFSDNPMIIHSCNNVDTLLWDHVIIIQCHTTYSPTAFDEKKSMKRRLILGPGVQFDKLNFFSEDTDWSGLEHELKQQDWVSEFRSLDPQQMLDKFLEICRAVSLKYVPIRKLDSSSKSESQIPRDRKNLMRKRRRINLLLRKTASEARRKKLKMEATEVDKTTT